MWGMKGIDEGKVTSSVVLPRRFRIYDRQIDPFCIYRVERSDNRAWCTVQKRYHEAQVHALL